MLNQNDLFQLADTKDKPYLKDSAGLSQLRVTVVNQPELVIEQWKYLERFASDPFSNYAWVKAWYDAYKHNSKCSPVIVLGTDQSCNPLFLLPLFRQKIGPFTVLQRPGRNHSAYYNGLFSPQCRQMINTSNAAQFWTMVFAELYGADVIAIDGVREIGNTFSNPLGFLPHMGSGNLSYVSKLSPDWEGFYKSKMSGKARSNIRRCEKRLSERGELYFKTGKGEDECLEMLRVLLAQKEEQFAARGIKNPYKSDSVTSFYEKLVQSADANETRSLVINSLFLDDKPLAVNLGMIQGEEFHGLIMSKADGPFSRFSPGSILLLRTMKKLADMGIRKFDFGVGQADYKDGLIDNGISRYHVLAPLGAKGKVFVSGIRLLSATKGIIKNTRGIKEMTKRAQLYRQKN